ncbi:hypothetical protein [Gimesia algae]|uniref:Uncharacterized protein n=1 Tax=Gimesia algae TaxID=2527971 RepID=A0A517VMF6_9PLAN|nr:hypothetical protein [Gimesia algae]QDT94194.1 hypothetical protein Pan161_58880 [Gimesia algae]
MIGFLKRLVGWLFGFDGREVERSKVEIIEIDLGAGPVWLDLDRRDSIEFIQRSKNND